MLVTTMAIQFASIMNTISASNILLSNQNADNSHLSQTTQATLPYLFGYYTTGLINSLQENSPCLAYCNQNTSKCSKEIKKTNKRLGLEWNLLLLT